jgi:hypothetical protein
VWLASSAAAHAQAPTFLERTEARVQLGSSARADVYSSLWVLSGVLSIDHAFSSGYGIGFDWGYFVADEAPRSDAASRWAYGPGDPWLRVWHRNTLGPRTSWRVDAGMTVPAAWLPRDATRRGVLRDGYALSAATRGLWNAWLWAPQQISLALAGALRHELSERVRLGLDAGLAGSLSMGDFTRDLGALYGQLGGHAEVHGELVTLGLRAQAVLTDALHAPLQLSGLGYLRFEQAHWQLEAAGLCNLNEPLGVFGDGLSVCSALLTFGVQP